jgi:hypothetical protein
MRHKTRIKRLREVYYIRGSLIRRTNKRQKRIERRVKESTIKTTKT